MSISFDLTDQQKDEEFNQKFHSCVLIEGVECGKGMGYSKKESQQLAAREALKNIKQKPEFLEQLFAAKEENQKANSTVLESEDAVMDSELSESSECLPSIQEECEESILLNSAPITDSPLQA